MQSNPPTPTNPEVEIEHWSGGVLAVVQFGGFVVEQNTLTSKRDTLAKALKADGIDFEDGFFTYCGYDSPTRQSPSRFDGCIGLKGKAMSYSALCPASRH